MRYYPCVPDAQLRGPGVLAPMSNNKRRQRARTARLGRNDPCPCGSGRKYKRCHGRAQAGSAEPEASRAALDAHHAKETLRRHQQGEGKPIISTEFAGHRVVAVGNKLYAAKGQKTFVDFLDNYLRMVLGGSWGNAEIRKPLEDRHQIMQWYDAVCAQQRRYASRPEGEIQASPLTGLMSAYYGLAYNLYLLQHSAELQAYLVARLKHAHSFYAAYYETFVAAWFILAGFELAIENERDSHNYARRVRGDPTRPPLLGGGEIPGAEQAQLRRRQSTVQGAAKRDRTYALCLHRRERRRRHRPGGVRVRGVDRRSQSRIQIDHPR